MFDGLKNLFKSNNPASPSPTQSSLPDQGEGFNEDFSRFVNDEYTRRQNERMPFELTWRLNIEFLNGNQYLDINPVSLTIQEIPRLFDHQEREVYNQMGTINETRCSKIARQKPAMSVRPASGEDTDLSATKVSQMLLSSSWSDQDMDNQYEDFVSWVELTGTCFWKVPWNKSKGRVVGNVLSASGKPIAINEGDLDTTVVNSFEIYPDSSFRPGLKQCRSIIHAKAYHLDEIEEIWGQRVDEESVDVMTLQKSGTSLGGLGYSFGSFRTISQSLKAHAVVKEYYERPTSKYPQGRFIVVAGTKTLYSGPLPYANGMNEERDFPFVRCVSIDRPGCLWGKTINERMIPLQRRYNALRNRKAEYLNLVAIGQWYVPIGSLDEGIELNNAPGNIIYYRPGINGAKPEPVQWPSLPASFENEESVLLQEFTQISGVSELARFSQAPSGTRSAVALQIGKEQDDTRVSTSVTRIANSVMEVGKMWIRLYRQFAQEPRLIRYVGGDYEVDVREWEKSDLRSDDIYIANIGALSETPAQKRQLVFSLLSSGLFNRPEMSQLTPESRKKVFELLEFGHWETGIQDDSTVQSYRSRKENRDIMEGKPVQVMDFDDHAIHIKEHNHQRMLAEWDELMKTPIGPYANQAMMAHIKYHIELQMQAMGMPLGGPAQQPPQQGQPQQQGQPPQKGGQPPPKPNPSPQKGQPPQPQQPVIQPKPGPNVQ